MIHDHDHIGLWKRPMCYSRNHDISWIRLDGWTIFYVCPVRSENTLTLKVCEYIKKKSQVQSTGKIEAKKKRLQKYFNIRYLFST